MTTTTMSIITITGHLKLPQARVTWVGMWWTKRQFTPERSPMCQVRRINKQTQPSNLQSVLTSQLTWHRYGFELFPYEVHTIEAMLRQKWFWSLDSPPPVWSDPLFADFLTETPTFNLVFSFCNGHSGWQEDRQRNPNCFSHRHQKYLGSDYKCTSAIFLPPWPIIKVWTCFHA